MFGKGDSLATENRSELPRAEGGNSIDHKWTESLLWSWDGHGKCLKLNCSAGYKTLNAMIYKNPLNYICEMSAFYMSIITHKGVQ